MKSIIKTKNKYILAALSFILSIACFITAFGINSVKVSADTVKYNQSEFTTIDKALNSTYNLFGTDATKKASVTNEVGVSTDVSVGGNANEVYVKASNATNASKRQGNVFIYVNLSDNIINAIKNTELTFTFKIDLKSQEQWSSTLAKKADKAEYLYFETIAGKRTADSFKYSDNTDENFSYLKTFNTEKNGKNGQTYTDYQTYEISVSSSQLKETDFNCFMLHAYSIFNGSGCTGWNVGAWTGNVLYAANPVVTVTSSDAAAPDADISVSDEGWVNTDKTLDISVSDADSGIGSVTVNGSAIAPVSISSDTKNATYKYTIKENGVYNVKVTDNVGNSKTYTYTESKIDRGVPELSVGIPEFFTDRENVSFTAILGGKELSPQYFYYTLDGTEPSTDNGSEILNGENIITVSENGAYTLILKAWDEAGNAVRLEKKFVVDDTDYVITAIAKNAIVYPESATAKCGTRVKFEFSGNDGYVFYKVTVNGKSVEVNGNTFEVLVEGNTEVVVLFRQQVELVPVQTVFEYSENGIEIPYNLDNELLSQINFTYKKDGELAAGLNTVGTYTVTWSIDNDDFIGGGDFEATVKSLKISIEDIVTEYEYSEEFGFEFKLKEGFEKFKKFIKVVIKKGEEAIDAIGTALKPDTYAYEIKIDETAEETINYVLEDTGAQVGELVVEKKNVDINVKGIEQFDGVEHNLEIAVFVDDEKNESIIPDSVYLIRNGVNVSDNKVLNAGDYSYTVAINENELYKGEVTGSFTVDKAKVKVIANAVSSVYGSDLSAVTYSLSGIDGSALDMFPTLSLSCNAVNSAAGNYEISLDDSALTSDVQANYDIEFIPAVYTVEKKEATVSVTEGLYKYYGEKDPELTYSVKGLVSGDKLDGKLTRAAGESVGTYEISAENLNNDNYDLAVMNSNFEILKRQVVIKTGAKTGMVYGDSVEPELYAKVLFGLEYLPENYKINIEREEGSASGVYPINLVSITDGDGNDVTSNFYVLSIIGNVIITKKIITVTPISYEKVYGDADPALFEYTAEGLIDGDEIFGNLYRVAGEEVGTYKITGNLYGDNYIIRIADASLTIKPKTVKVTAVAASKIYGSADPETFEFIAEGLIGEDKLLGSLCRETGENVGEYNILVGDIYNANYKIDFVGAKYTINKKNVSVKVDDQVKIFGEDDPEFTYLVEDAEAEEVIKIVITREVGESAGTYAINATCSAENYNVTVEVGTLTIEKAEFEFYVDDEKTVYNGEAQFISGNKSVENVTYTYYDENDVVVDKPVDAGVYKIVAIFGGDENHKAGATAEATFTISKKTVGIIIDSNPVKYTGSSIMPKYTLSDKVNVIVEFDAVSEAVEAGEYTYRIYTTDKNYTLYVSGTLKIV